VAGAAGCAFWDTFAAMGGPDTMWRWYRANPRQSFGDLTHLAPAGGEILGGLLYGALVQGLLEYLERNERIAAPPAEHPGGRESTASASPPSGGTMPPAPSPCREAPRFR